MAEAVVEIAGYGPIRVDTGEYAPTPEALKQMLDQKFSELRSFVDTVWSGMRTEEKAALALAPVPIAGDVAGIYSDATMYINDPESRTIANFLMSGASIAIPGMLSPSQIKAAKVAAENLTNISAKLSDMPISKAVPERVDANFSGRKMSSSRNDDYNRVTNLSTEIADVRNMEAPELSIVNLEGRPFVTSYGDRTAAGGILTGVNGVALDVPVDLRGGQDYMFDPLSDGRVWASADPVIQKHLKAAAEIKRQTGQDPIFLPWRMAPTGGDFSTMTSDLMVQYAKQNMNPKDIAEANRMIREVGRNFSKKNQKTGKAEKYTLTIPDFKGIENPEVFEQISNMSGPQRKVVLETLDTKFRGKGGLSLTEARLAVTDPQQRQAMTGGLQNVGIIDAGGDVISSAGHRTYGAGLQGEGLGRLTEQGIGVFQLLPDLARQFRVTDPLKPTANQLYSIDKVPQTGIITEDILRSMQEAGSLN